VKQDQNKRIVVIADETVVGQGLPPELIAKARRQQASLVVVCPALNTRLAHWVSDVDGATAAAAGRLERSLATLENAGHKARGQVGDPDPVQALADAVALYAPEEVVIVPRQRSKPSWLEKNMVERARRVCRVPLTIARGS